MRQEVPACRPRPARGEAPQMRGHGQAGKYDHDYTFIKAIRN